MVGKTRNKVITLVTIIKSKYTKSVLKKEYIKLLEILFLPQNLNLRNSIIHGNDASFDYTSIYIYLQYFYNLYMIYTIVNVLQKRY